MAKQPSLRLILASGSRGRRELLERAGLRFDVQPSHIDEPTGEGVTDPGAFVQDLAWRKARAVAPQIADGVILAADTVGWADGQIVGKPNDAEDARRILKLLGRTVHELWTGVCLWRRPDDLQIAWQEVSHVRTKGMTDAEIDTYLATRQWEGCSGAYAIQPENDPYVQIVSGSMSNVIGLPMETLAKVIEQFRL